MRNIVIILILVCSGRAMADWACESNTTVLNGDGVITTCGQGRGRSAEEAKAWAFHEAHLEFWRLCMASNTCKGYEVSIAPERMECTETKTPNDYFSPSKWFCKRSVRFMVDRSKEPCDEKGREVFKGCPMNERPWDGV